MNPTARRWARRAGAAAAATALFVGVVGFAHTPNGRFLLGYLPGAGACPVGVASPAQVDRARAVGLARVRGQERATARPALGFTLDVTARDDVSTWASRHGVTCSAASAMTLACRDVPATALPGAIHAADEVQLTFDSRGRLVGAEAMRRGLDSQQAIALVDARIEDARKASGGTVQRTGATDGAHLVGGAARRAEGELRFVDYRVVITAMNQGGARPVVRERYQAIAPEADGSGS